MRGTLNKPTFLAVAGVLIATLSWLVVRTADWIDRPFPGFLILANGVVASAGLTHWPAVADGTIFQSHIESYDGIPFSDPLTLKSYVASKPVGHAILYRFSGLNGPRSKSIETRLFSTLDAFLLFGVILFSAVALLSVSLAISYVAPTDPASTGSVVALSITGVFALTAADLYGPYHFFRLHALAECFLGAGGIHMALVFPQKTRLCTRHSEVIKLAYAASTFIAAANQAFLFHPIGYTVTHLAGMGWAGIAFASVVATQTHALIRPANYAARQRVLILALGTFASIAPAVLVAAGSSISGGEAPENLISWTGAFFPVAVGYAVLKSDLLEVDSVLRRTANYVLLSIFVGSIYTIFIAVTDRLLRDSLAASKPLSIIAFSILLSFAILPARDQLQHLVDRVFFRSSYDFRTTVEDASNQLARLIELEPIQHLLSETIRSTLNPESIVLSILPDDAPPESKRIETNQAVLAPHDLPSGGIDIEFRTRNRVVAHLILGRKLSGNLYTGLDRGLLKVLANQGAIAIENALAVDQLQELNRNLERRVSERTSELASALADLTATQQQLLQAERLAAVGELAAGVAHEINNPLNFARNSLRTLQTLVIELADYSDAVSTLSCSDPSTFKTAYSRLRQRFSGADIQELTSDVKQLSEILETGLDRTAQLVQDLRDFASPRKSAKTIYLASTLVSEAIDLISSTTREQGISIEVCSPTTEPHLEGDAQAISRVLLNVLKNATDALEGSDHGSISISVDTNMSAGTVDVHVRDNGPGMSAEIKEKVFEPFFSTKPAGKGTGLGLALCKRVMQDHKGEITIESQARRGTTVRLSLPFVGDTDQDSQKPA